MVVRNISRGIKDQARSRRSAEVSTLLSRPRDGNARNEELR